MKKPNQPNFSTQLSQYYMARDLYVGAQVIINDHKFVFVDADEYAYNYMERNAEKDGVSALITNHLSEDLINSPAVCPCQCWSDSPQIGSGPC